MKTKPEKLQLEPAFYRNRILVFLVTTGILLASFLLATTLPRGPVICMSHGIAGMPCPACGLTRAFCALAKMDFLTALSFNALCIPLALLFVIAPAVALCEMIRGRRYRFYRFMYSMKPAYVFGAAVGIYHVARFSYWISNGTLLSQYIKTSWTYSLLF